MVVQLLCWAKLNTSMFYQQQTRSQYKMPFAQIEYNITSKISQLSDVRGIGSELMEPTVHLSAEPREREYTDATNTLSVRAALDYFAKFASPEVISRLHERVAGNTKILNVTIVSPQ